MRGTHKCAVSVLVIAMMVLAAGCTGAAETPAGDGDVVITHAKGTAVITGTPKRVVALGAADAQIASALGAEIVGAVRNPAADNGNWPTVSPALADDVADLDALTPSIAEIAARAPDLILATTAQQAYLDSYDRLAAIAPTLVYFGEPLQDSGELLLERIAQALRVPDRAERIAADSDAAIGQFVRSHPGLAGAGIAFGQYAGTTTYLIADPKSAAGQFFGRLGMNIPAQIRDLRRGAAAAPMGMATPSDEDLAAIGSADIALVSVYGSAAEQFLSIPTVSGSSVARAGHLHAISTDLAAVLLQPNPATTRYALAGLQPYLTGVVGG